MAAGELNRLRFLGADKDEIRGIPKSRRQRTAGTRGDHDMVFVCRTTGEFGQRIGGGFRVLGLYTFHICSDWFDHCESGQKFVKFAGARASGNDERHLRSLRGEMPGE